MDLSEFATQIFASQPFSQFIEARLAEVTSDSATIEIELKPHHLQQHGFAHGGVISYLADNAITFAGGLALQGNALTSEFKINYLKPAQGQKLRCHARAVSHGRKQAVCVAEVFAINDSNDTDDGATDTEVLCAIAQGTVVKSE